MNFEELTQHFVLIVVLGCLVIGYIIKHASFLKRIPNNDIPVILAIVGALTNGFVGGFTMENVIYGAFMGLTSTGLHQAFTHFVEGTKETIE